MLEPWSLGNRTFKKQIALRLYQRGDLDRASTLHATAKSEARQIRALGFSKPIAVIPHGVDVPPEQPRPLDSNRIRTALFMSRLHKKKGLLTLLEAWAIVRPAQWRLIIAGPDEDGHQSIVEATVERLGLRGSVTVIGPAFGAEKRALLQSADLFVLPTHSENFGNVIAEALAHGLPVVTTVAAPWQELEETQSGWWIDVGIDPLVAAMRSAFDARPETLRAMGTRGRALVRERYDWSVIGFRYRALYEWILYGGVPPRFVCTG